VASFMIDVVTMFEAIDEFCGIFLLMYSSCAYAMVFVLCCVVLLSFCVVLLLCCVVLFLVVYVKTYCSCQRVCDNARVESNSRGIDNVGR
jgi:hypothetical protein